VFHFAEEPQQEEQSFLFFNLYESMLGGAFHPVLRDKLGDFHPMQDLRNLFNETAQQLSQAEETAMATASQMYEHLVPSGSQMDKHLTAMSQATYAQLSEAWNSVKNMKERLETARFLSQQRARIRQQLKGYRVMLNRMREMSSAVPSAQMAAMMRRITECNLALESLESRAQAAFVKATGFARKNLPSFLTQARDEPRHYARYSSDPLLGVATYPLGFHLLILGGTEIPLRIMMKRRGFERRSIGPVSYYFHPGRYLTEVEVDSTDRNGNDSDEDAEFDLKTPIIFVHGIGIGLIVYMPLIDKLLETGRPILLPEIPYVSGFRPWLSPLSVLSPGSVVSTMTAMLASHGFMRGTWVGHSYGTSWLSYMVKFARHAVASLVFLDPICFCLHVPRLTKQFVYSKPDPGTVSYIVRTDIIVNWTIQRSFPWAWIILFLEQIGDVLPCAVFLSDKDALVPSDKVETYLRKHSVPVCDFEGVDPSHFDQRLSCTVFRGAGHGDWTETPSATMSTIAVAVEALCRQSDEIHPDEVE
jgi:pimeloyl-ACP methyl ester carboxylesterase